MPPTWIWCGIAYWSAMVKTRGGGSNCPHGNCWPWLFWDDSWVASISCFWHIFSNLVWLSNKTHTHMRAHLLAHICLHIELLGLYMPGPLYRQVASKQPRGVQPRLYTAWQVPPADHSLPAEPLWLFQFIFGVDVTLFFLHWNYEEWSYRGRKKGFGFVVFEYYFFFFKKRDRLESMF